MYIKTLLFLLFLVSLASSPALSQEKFTVSGHITDAETGEALIGAAFQAMNAKMGVMTNSYGFYSLTVPAGTYTFRCSFIGYIPVEITAEVTASLRKDVRLTPEPAEVEEVVIKSRADDTNVTSPEMGTIEIKPGEIRDAPVLFGEHDILKTMQLLPGIGETEEGSSGFFVRGGSPDENLMLLDEAPVYNASHFFGFFSVFNSDAINNVKIMKGAAPPEYGGRLSSVMDIRMKEGNNRTFHADGGLGLISSRLTLQGPIAGDRGSFLLSGRRTYADIFLKLAKNEDVKNSSLYFYDLNLKANYQAGPKDRLFLSGYFGRDMLGFADEFSFDWGNATGTVRWNHIFSDRLFSNTSLIFSNFDYVLEIRDSGEKYDITSGIRDFNLKEDFQFFLTPNSILKTGFNTISHKFTPGRITATDGSSFNTYKVREKYAYESAAYIGHECRLLDRLTVDYGLRMSLFTAVGPGVSYTFDDEGNEISERDYGKNDAIKSYGGLEPRVIATYSLDESQSLKASFARNRQYIHLLSNMTSATPFDIWFPCTNNVKPGTSTQVSAGYFRNFRENMYESSVETYYKDLGGQVDYRNGADIFLNKHVESELVYGKGWSCGAEFSLKKTAGKLTGWVSYDLSKTRRKFRDINEGKSFPSRYDRTHDFSVVGIYRHSEKWTYSAAWVFHTGNAVTFPSGKYEIDSRPVNYYTERNGYRMPMYQRLDLGATMIHKKTKKFESSVNFSIYNAYGHKNAYSIYFRENKDNPKYTEAARVSLFTFFPSITYNFSY